SVEHFSTTDQVVTEKTSPGPPAALVVRAVRTHLKPEAIMRQWLKNLFARKRTVAARRPGFRPGLECLEDRVTPASVLPQALFPHTPHPYAPVGPPVRTQKPFLPPVTPLSNNTILLRFSKRLGPEANRTRCYDIPGLGVLGVQVSRDRKSVTLTTTP